MKKMMIAIAAIAMLAAPALAADLPSKQTQVTTDRQLAAAVANDAHWYVGANLGFNYLDDVSVEDSQKTLGATVGYQYDRNFAAELAFTQFFEKDGVGEDGQALAVNGLALVPTGTAFTPYVLAGIGAGFNGLGDNGDVQPIYNLGAGVRYAVTDAVDLDVRYTRIDAWENPVTTDSVTAGLAFKF